MSQKNYEFVGGSHDGEDVVMPEEYEVGFAMAIDTRPPTTGKREVYQLKEDGKFHYKNFIMPRN